jgi:hypothetical protein
MGWTTHFWKCNNCNYETVYTSRQTHPSKNHKCKTIERMQFDEYTFERMDMILHTGERVKMTGGDQYEYWKKRVNDRIKYLTPLIDEVKEKGLNLWCISKELNQEWLLLIESVEYHKFNK